MADIIRNFLVSILVFLPGSSASLFPVGRVNICSGETRMFTCHVSTATTSPQIDWLIQFEAPDLSDVQQTYISEDHLGDVVTDNREEYTFTFNLTFKSAFSLVSTLTVTLNAHDQTSFDTATVDCNQANESAMLHNIIITDLPSPPMDLKQINIQGVHSSHRVVLQWNASEAADYYVITVSPSVNVPGSSFKFITPNTTIVIPVLYNQEYDISVVASNCAGNSTPSVVTLSIASSGCGSSLIDELTFVSGWISDTCSKGEGSSINIHCSGSLSSNFTLVSVCSSEGIWQQESTSVTQTLWPSRNPEESGTLLQSSFPPIYALPIASVSSFVLGLFLGVILTVCIMKLQLRKKVLSSATATTQDQKHMPVQMPVYEELCVQAADMEKVVNNVAYGPMCN